MPKSSCHWTVLWDCICDTICLILIPCRHLQLQQTDSSAVFCHCRWWTQTKSSVNWRRTLRDNAQTSCVDMYDSQHGNYVTSEQAGTRFSLFMLVLRACIRFLDRLLKILSIQIQWIVSNIMVQWCFDDVTLWNMILLTCSTLT